MPGMMGESDPEVKSLQELAWSLQTLSCKPGCKLPEEAKRDAYRLTTKAISLCTNAEYVERSDFEERAAVYRKQIEARKIELQELEKDLEEQRTTKCYRATSDGGYTVGLRASDVAAPTGELERRPMTSSGGGSGGEKLTAKEVSAMCAGDPEALWLGSAGIQDPDVEALLEGLKKSGSQLTAIDLSQNQIADTGIQKLISGFAGGLCPKLQELWLTDNVFSEHGVQMLNGGLKVLRKELTVHLAEGNGAVDATRERFKKAADEPRLEPTAPASEELQKASKDIDFEILDGKLRARISMPDTVNSAADFDLDISEERLVVRAVDAVVGDASMPCRVDPETTQAKFSRKTHILTVTIDAVG